MVTYRLLAGFTFLLVFVFPAYTQTIEKISFDKGDSTNGYYLAVRPRSNNIQGTLLLLNSFAAPEYLLPETRLHNVAYANDLLMVFVSMGTKLYADTAAIGRINAVAKSLAGTFAIDTSRIALAGHDYAGNIALRYTELANQQPSLCSLHPKAVFTVDSSVDLFGLWNWCQRQIRKNYYPGTVGDAKFLSGIMTKEKGTITDNPGTYQYLTAFYKDDPATGNEQYLQHTALRLYYDVDAEWQLANRRNSLYDTNIPDGSELVNRLLLLGNTRAEFVSSKKPGRKSNGLRSPNSISMVDEVDCIHWVKNALEIFDPITWQPPYTLPVPAGWSTERFTLPPVFASGFSYKGVEELRFPPGWDDPASEEYWTYAYLWWIDDKAPVDADALQGNLRALYTGLVGSNIAPRHIPAEKIIPVVASLKKTATIDGDKASFSGTVSMLDYLGQHPMVLHCRIHVKDARVGGKTAVLIEASPKDFQHPVWKILDNVQANFVPPAHQ